MKRPSQYLRARGRAGRGHRPGAGRCARGHCKRRRGGPGGASTAAIRQAGGVIGPAIRPKAGRARRHRAGAARRRAVLAALWLAVCRRCSMARRSAVCWHRAGGRRWHGMQQAGRRVVRRSSRPFLLLLSPRCRAVFAVCRRGQILHLTAYRCSGKG